MSNEPREIARIDKARQEIAAAKTVDGVKTIRDKAEAARLYAKKIGMSREMQNDLGEIILEAEARAGEILATMREKGERQKPGGKSKSQSGIYSPGLSDIGVTPKQSSQWQKVAAVPEADRQKYFAETRKHDRQVNAAGLLKSVTTKEPKPKPLPKSDGSGFEPDVEFKLEVQGLLSNYWRVLNKKQKQSICRFFQGEVERIMKEVGDGR